MKKAFAALSLIALSIASTSAFAAGAAPQVTTIAPSGFVSVQARVPDYDVAATIVSTFNSDTANLYDCCQGWTISSEDSIVGARQDVAMPFTPGKNYAVKKITVGVGYVAGTNGVYVSLNADNGGVPGAVIKKGNPTGLPTFGTCCATVSIGGGGAPVTAGTQYWVVVKTTKKQPDTWDAWNINNIGASGPFAFNTGSGWQTTSGTLGAFSVKGN